MDEVLLPFMPMDSFENSNFQFEQNQNNEDVQCQQQISSSLLLLPSSSTSTSTPLSSQFKMFCDDNNTNNKNKPLNVQCDEQPIVTCLTIDDDEDVGVFANTSTEIKCNHKNIKSSAVEMSAASSILSPSIASSKLLAQLEIIPKSKPRSHQKKKQNFLLPEKCYNFDKINHENSENNNRLCSRSHSRSRSPPPLQRSSMLSTHDNTNVNIHNKTNQECPKLISSNSKKNLSPIFNTNETQLNCCSNENNFNNGDDDVEMLVDYKRKLRNKKNEMACSELAIKTNEKKLNEQKTDNNTNSTVNTSIVLNTNGNANPITNVNNCSKITKNKRKTEIDYNYELDLRLNWDKNAVAARPIIKQDCNNNNNNDTKIIVKNNENEKEKIDENFESNNIYNNSKKSVRFENVYVHEFEQRAGLYSCGVPDTGPSLHLGKLLSCENAKIDEFEEIRAKTRRNNLNVLSKAARQKRVRCFSPSDVISWKLKHEESYWNEIRVSREKNIGCRCKSIYYMKKCELRNTLRELICDSNSSSQPEMIAKQPFRCVPELKGLQTMRREELIRRISEITMKKFGKKDICCVDSRCECFASGIECMVERNNVCGCGGNLQVVMSDDEEIHLKSSNIVDITNDNSDNESQNMKADIDKNHFNSIVNLNSDGSLCTDGCEISMNVLKDNNSDNLNNIANKLEKNKKKKKRQCPFTCSNPFGNNLKINALEIKKMFSIENNKNNINLKNKKQNENYSFLSENVQNKLKDWSNFYGQSSCDE